MIRVTAERLDAVWETVRTATEAGDLGDVAKAGSDWDGMGWVFVYARDSSDHGEVGRLLAALRRLGITHRLNYKTDEATRRDIYGAGSSLYTSPPGSLNFHTPKGSKGI
jgi:Basophilic leukemia-expressed protein Bles03